MVKVDARTLFATFMFLAVATVAAGASPHSYDLPDHGALILLVQDSWTSEFKQLRTACAG
jgi:hypothetical protein